MGHFAFVALKNRLAEKQEVVNDPPITPAVIVVRQVHRNVEMIDRHHRLNIIF